MVVLTPKEKRALYLLLFCFLLGVVLYWAQEGELVTGREISVKIENSNPKPKKLQNVNLNEATQIELEQISGIGPTMAKRILEYRKNNRRFYKKEELKEVKGIGEKRFQQIEKYVTVR